ncbi:MAG: hypothetical protein JJT75_04375 [Opitutales bacterium]|nr:hypothetical protein [Opitutales bacterium]MCH8541436.1 hypothetical protein [Opitutales bacterium]
MTTKIPVSSLIVLLVALLHSGSLLSADDTQKNGELTIYDRPTSIGIVAKREFHDTEGRVIKTHYYRYNFKASAGEMFDESGPYTEENLILDSVRTKEYNDDNRLIRRNRYDENMELQGWAEFKENTTLSRRSDGTRNIETRSEGDRQLSTLYFDQTGENLIAINGEVPGDIEFSGGWGKQVDGLVCGVGLNQSKGQLGEIRFYVTIRNMTDTSRRFITSIAYHQIQVELLDAEGNVMPQDNEHIKQRKEKLVRINRGINENRQLLRPQQARITSGGYVLKDWYSDIPAGTYFLTVKQRTDDSSFALVSHPVELEIVAKDESEHQ